MDDIDFTISLLLMANSRTPYSKFAEMFNMSVNSIHKRVKSMVELGVIKNFNARLGSNIFSNFTGILMFGVSKTKNPKSTIEKIGAHDNIFNVTQASSNLFYIHANLENINVLESLVSFVRQVGQIDELTVGIHSYPVVVNTEDLGDISLSKLDYLIIHSLKNNSRKPISEISDEVKASTKTVTRHLNRLIEKGLVILSINWYPDKTAEFLSFVQINLAPSTSVDKISLVNDLRKEFGSKMIFSWTFGNLPNLLIICLWTRIMKELQEIETKLMSKSFESVKVTVLLEGKNFTSWVDQYLEDKINKIKAESS
ncbi:MAG: DNA-binding transcriptional regulator AsnC [Candidatus Lokiarchaeum sp. GC14_75]|nr:MAG: DNA-binding transcriptional regulator AsnC [Candidatus Lokiarchaeum sp. GC14_75]